MIQHKYSPRVDAFYPVEMLAAYDDLPDDLIDVDGAVYQVVLDARSRGLSYRIARDGLSVSVSPGPAYDWDADTDTAKWVLNKTKQAAIEAQAKADADAQAASAAREAKAQALATIVVTTTSGKTFDGNEVARGRMADALYAAEKTGQTEEIWILADNTPAVVTVDELAEARVLAIQRVGQIIAGT